MRNKLRSYTTDESNGLLLPSGMMTQDSEKKALRLHDGETLGGYELLGTQAVAMPLPGPTTLIAGDATAGFYGETTSEELITYSALSSAIGLSAGILQFDNLSQWLKLALDGKVLYVAKRPIRYSLSWEHIYQAGAVYGDGTVGNFPSGAEVEQNAMVTIGSHVFRVRLMRGVNNDPTSVTSDGYDLPETHQSEWNRLMYPIHSGVHTGPGHPVDPSVPYNQWAAYTDTDLIVDYRVGKGSVSHCQEATIDGSERIMRGHAGLTHLHKYDPTYSAGTNRGWRPVLEPIQ